MVELGFDQDERRLLQEIELIAAEDQIVETVANAATAGIGRDCFGGNA